MYYICIVHTILYTYIVHISKTLKHAVVSKGIVLFLPKIIETFSKKFSGVYNFVDTSACPK